MTVKSLQHTSITDNIFYRSMLAGNSAYIPSSYELIASEILTGSQASVTFSNLGDYSSTYQHLQIRGLLRDQRGLASSIGRFRFNGDTGSNYIAHSFYGNGSSAGGYTYTGGADSTYGYIGDIPGSTADGDNLAPFILDVVDAYESKYKTVKGFCSMTTDYNWVTVNSSLWLSTNALTSITIFSQFADLAAKSRVSLYGIKVS